MMADYAVVEFPTIDGTLTEVEVVPTIWLFEDNSKCYWPRSTSAEKFRKMVLSRKAAAEDWNVYDVKRVFGTYDCILKAKEKARLTEETSDLNSDVGRRKKARTTLKLAASTLKKKPVVRTRSPSVSSDEDSSELDSLPATPPKFISTQARPTKANKAAPKPLKGNAQTVELNNRDAHGSQTQGSSSSVNKSASSLPKYSSRPPVYSDLESPNSSVHSWGPALTFGSNDFNRQVSQDLHLIKTRLTQIENTQTLILAQLTSKGTTGEGAECIGVASDFPLRSTAAFEELDEKLEHDSGARKQLMQYWKSLGGKSAADMTRRSLRRLMTDTVASQMNWRGHNGKLAFESTKCIEILTASVQGFFGSGLKIGNGKLIEEATKEWLKQAANRIKQKTERCKGRQSVEDEEYASNDGQSD